MDGSTSHQDTPSEPLAGRLRHRRGAKALVTSDRSVLLVRERHADGTPFWTLPGGGVETHETPAEGLCREMREELRCPVHVGEAVSAFWYVHDSLDAGVSVYTVHPCSLLSTPVPNAAEGVAAARWVDVDALPPRTLPQVRYCCENALSTPVAADD
jgi:8-oxo-dGTP diphosphatase